MENHEHTETIPVKGMTCASCAITIEKTLKKIPGVSNCEVNIGNEKAKITYDQTQTSMQEMNKKIGPLGYTLAIGDGEHSKHVMPDGSVMDHSEHLGLGQTKADKLAELARQKTRVILSFPITIITFVFMMWEIAVMNVLWVPKFFIAEELFQTVSFILASFVFFYIGSEFTKEVGIFIKHKVANMYTLIGIGTLVAYSYSAVIFLFPQLRILLGLPSQTYFDVTIVVIGFVYLGKYLETKSKLSTGEAIEKLLGLQAKTAIVRRDGMEMEIKIEEVVTGDEIIIKPGSKIPVDGTIIEGGSAVDESMITGESIPVDKVVGDLVIGSTLNKQGALVVKATRIGSETVLSQIIKMVDEAQGSRAPIQGLADKISGIFVPVVLIIAVATLLAWFTIAPFFIAFSEALSFGILCFTGVLVIACPCALGLATPTAIIVGTGKGAENGILIKDAESLEKLHTVNMVVTDKTGTITKGKPEVTDIIILNGGQESEILAIAATLEKLSEHPLAEAIVAKAIAGNIKLEKADDFSVIEGKGVVGEVKGKRYYVGNLRLAQDLGVTVDQKQMDQLATEGKTPVLMITNKQIISIIGIADTLKDNAIETVERLHKLGLQVVMLTGDNEKTAQYIAKQVGIDQVIAEVLPQDKAQKVKELQTQGKIVAMVGDGVNDAPALAQANVGIAMSTGTDVAIASASITLLKGDFSKVLQAINLSKFTLRAIKQNLFWAFAYNIVGIPLAAGLFYPFFGVLLNPAFAGLAMALSSVSVVSNSLRLRFAKL